MARKVLVKTRQLFVEEGDEEEGEEEGVFCGLSVLFNQSVAVRWWAAGN